MLGSFFVLCDYFERLAPELMAVPLLGGFVKGGVCATAGWVVAWPYETVKSLVQRSRRAQSVRPVPAAGRACQPLPRSWRLSALGIAAPSRLRWCAAALWPSGPLGPGAELLRPR